MRIYTKSGDLAFRTFNFPDQQPHFVLETICDGGFNEVRVEMAIKSPADLFMCILVSSVLTNLGMRPTLDIRYLMGARMDRQIDPMQPFTLRTVCRMINAAYYHHIRILDVHSDVAINTLWNAENVLPYEAVRQVRKSLGYPTIVCPDKGARQRVTDLCGGYDLECSKTRDPQTGALTGFKVPTPYPSTKFSEFEALIVDDICDGGGTFVGLAKELRKAGAKKVYLYVTHGIFSKGLVLEGIDHIYTTDTYTYPQLLSYPEKTHGNVTIIPLSMKDL